MQQHYMYSGSPTLSSSTVAWRRCRWLLWLNVVLWEAPYLSLFSHYRQSLSYDLFTFLTTPMNTDTSIKQRARSRKASLSNAATKKKKRRTSTNFPRAVAVATRLIPHQERTFLPPPLTPPLPPVPRLATSVAARTRRVRKGGKGGKKGWLREVEGETLQCCNSLLT